MSMINSSSKKISLGNHDFGTSGNYGKIIKGKNTTVTFNDFYEAQQTEELVFDDPNKNETIEPSKSDVEIAYERQRSEVKLKIDALNAKYDSFVNSYLEANGNNMEIDVTSDSKFLEEFSKAFNMSYEEFQKSLEELQSDLRLIDAAFMANVFKNSSAKDIFKKGAYGGNQGNVANLVSAYMQGYNLDAVKTKQAIDMVNMIKKYFPYATDMDVINISEAFTSSGCGYVAMSNALCMFLGNMENGSELCKEKFGFDLYYVEGEEKFYNIENMALTMFLDRFKDLDTSAILDPTFAGGTSYSYYVSEFNDFLHERGLNCAMSRFPIDLSSTDAMDIYGLPSFSKVLQEYMTYYSGSYVLISSEHFDLAVMDEGDLKVESRDSALSNALPNGNVMQNVGGHAMLVTGIDQSGNPIVSSWSGEYRFIAESPARYFQQKPDEARLALEFFQFSIIEGE